MKTRFFSVAVVIAGVVMGIASCNKEMDSVDTQYSSLDPPSPPYNYNSTGSDDEAILGRVLFYDSRLSVNSSISCATCHKQAIAFSDDESTSLGFKNKPAGSNTLPIQNIRSDFSGGNIHLIWDGRETPLDEMMLKPILNHVEMGMDDGDAIVERVKVAPYYAELFMNAYSSPEITIDKIACALAAFIGSINSSNTLFDEYLNNVTDPRFSDSFKSK